MADEQPTAPFRTIRPLPIGFFQASDTVLLNVRDVVSVIEDRSLFTVEVTLRTTNADGEPQKRSFQAPEGGVMTHEFYEQLIGRMAAASAELALAGGM